MIDTLCENCGHKKIEHYVYDVDMDLGCCKIMKRGKALYKCTCNLFIKKKRVKK